MQNITWCTVYRVWCKEFRTHSSYKLIYILGPTNFGYNNSGYIFLYSGIFLIQTKFGSKELGSKEIFGQKIIFAPKNFESKNV